MTPSCFPSGWDAGQVASMGSGEDGSDREELAIGYSVQLLDVDLREGVEDHLHIGPLGVWSVDIRRAWLEPCVRSQIRSAVERAAAGSLPRMDAPPATNSATASRWDQSGIGRENSSSIVPVSW
jgi:hypothetical protein